MGNAISTSWTQTLSAKHTDPQPFAGKHLTCHWRCTEKYNCKCTKTDSTKCRGQGNSCTEVITSTTPECTSPPILPPFCGDIEPQPNTVIILRNYDGQQGLLLADVLQQIVGVDILSGRGSKNKCSKALEDNERKKHDGGNGDTCSHFNDPITKLLPLLGEGHGGNYDGSKSMAKVALPYTQEILNAGKTGIYAGKTGSVQVLRFRTEEFGAKNSKSQKLKPRKQKVSAKKKELGHPSGDHLHDHVDQDPKVETVVIMSLGARVIMSFDDATCCEKFIACKEAMGKCNGDEKHRYLSVQCSTCNKITLCSGDIVIFNGHPSAGIAHAIIDTLPDVDQERNNKSPAWLQDCRVSFQYRCYNYDDSSLSSSSSSQSSVVDLTSSSSSTQESQTSGSSVVDLTQEPQEPKKKKAKIDNSKTTIDLT